MGWAPRSEGNALDVLHVLRVGRALGVAHPEMQHPDVPGGHREGIVNHFGEALLRHHCEEGGLCLTVYSVGLHPDVGLGQLSIPAEEL